MKRRDFLKLIGVAPIAPSVLAAKEKLPFKLNDAQKRIISDYNGATKTITIGNPMAFDYIYEIYCKRPIGFALEDIPKDKYGWVQIYTTAHYAE